VCCRAAQVVHQEKPAQARGRYILACPGAVIGIDLGTSNVAVAVIEDGLPRMLPDGHGQLTSPSVVAFHEVGLPRYVACMHDRLRHAS